MTRLLSRPGSILAGLLLCLLLYVPPAAMTPFFTKGEPREALVVRNMLDAGDWLLPKRASANGWTIASKPPFFHWLGAAASTVAGRATEGTVRLPSIVLCTIAVLAVGFVAREAFGPLGGLAAMLVLATSFEWLRAASTARVDGTLTALMTIGTLIFHRAVAAGGLSFGSAVVAYLALACAALTKGPVGVVLPGLVLAIALTVRREWRLVRRYRPVLGLLIVGVVVGGWYALAMGLGGDSFVRKQVLKENVFRFVGATQMRSGHSHPFYYYFPTLLAGLLPWTPFVLAAFVSGVRDTAARHDPRVAFPLVWFAVVFVFYSLADAKRSVYLLALYPAAALVTAWWWTELSRGRASTAWLDGTPARVVVGVLCGIALVPLVSTLAAGLGLDPFAALAPMLAPKDRANLPLVLGIIDQHFWLVLLGTGAMLGALLACARAMRRRDPATLLLSYTIFGLALWTLVFTVFQPELARLRTLGPFVRKAASMTDGQPLAFYRGSFDFGAMFYAPPGTRHWKPGRRTDAGPRYLFIWDTALAELPPAERGQLTILDTSEGTDPRGRQRLVLVRRDG